jgi:beta-glucanase (GH16 family)
MPFRQRHVLRNRLAARVALCGTSAGLVATACASNAAPTSAFKTALPIRSTPGPTAPLRSPGGSGPGMPSGDIPGWRMTYAQDFTGSSLPAGWSAYNGEPGGDSNGWWDPSNLTVSGGYLHFNGRYDPSVHRYSTAGVGFGGMDQTYGMYLVRMKGDYEPGVAISDIALLWPSGNSWPPEIDFFEDSGGTRTLMSAALHPGPNGDDCCQIQHSLALNATQWHTVGVQWTPSSVSYMVDGNVWATVAAAQLSGGQRWPAQAMSLDLQTQNLHSNYPARPTENMTVDWVVEYAPV